MPVSVMCESTANAVNAALRDSLGVGINYTADEVKTGNSQLHSSIVNRVAINDDLVGSSSSDDDNESNLQNRLVANAKRVLLTKIDYEEVENYNQTVLDNLKSKYTVIKPNETYQNNNAVCNNKSNSSASGVNGHGSCTADINGNAATSSNNSGSGCSNINNINNNIRNNSFNKSSTITTAKQQQNIKPNPNELPTPKRVLFPRENIRVGWNGTERNWNVGVGMINVGNTCYLNSTLQALFHVPSLANWLLSDTAHMERCDNADSSCIICAMAKTLLVSQTNQSAIRPYLVYSKLKSICKHMVMGRQEDAHEFLRFLVEAMEKSYLSRFRNYKDFDQYSKETTPLNQILGGYLKSAVRCLSCDHVSVTFQHFQDLLLDIRKADTIEEALESYFARERLEDTGYKCESCKKKVSATKQFSLERAPIALCMQLKRFSIVGTKLNKQITIRPRLELTKFSSRKQSGEQLIYKLVAMVTHLGVSQHCGHYTAIGLTDSGTYYNYDDSYVRPISIQSVCNTNAYIIFYEMENVNLRGTADACTQTSGAAIPKINGVRINSNGHATPNGSPQLMIGPQLPPGGLTNYTAVRQNSITNGSNKITIQLKNGTANTVRSATTPAVTATETSTTATITTLSDYQPSNKPNLLTMTGKFQEPTHTKSALISTSNKGQTVAVINGNKSSSNSIYPSEPMISSSDDDGSDYNDNINNNDSGNSNNDNKVSSSTSKQQLSAMPITLPNVPKLFEHYSNGNGAINGSAKKANNNMPAKQLKSLVPYESGTDEEDAVIVVGNTSTVNTNVNILKRRSSSSSSLSSNAGEEEQHKPVSKILKKSNSQFRLHNVEPTVAVSVSKVSKNGNSNNSKQKTDAIDEIFSVYKNKSNNNVTTSNKKNTQKANNPLPVNSTTILNLDSSDDNANDENSDDNDNDVAQHSKPTPPSPPVIKTKLGLWQVTPSTESDTNIKKANTSVKNLKNPFANKHPVNNSAIKKPKMHNSVGKSDKHIVCNGYAQETTNDDDVNELLKQSHRGYGAPVLSWNGTQNEIEKEIIADAREQQQRDWEHEEENDMDRGRQRKLKTKNAGQNDNSTPGYNPFQEHENQRRWHKAGFNYRFHQQHHPHHQNQHTTQGSHFRHHFHQRNKFKFNRFGNKFQQQRALQRYVAAAGYTNGLNRQRQQDT